MTGRADGVGVGGSTGERQGGVCPVKFLFLFFSLSASVLCVSAVLILCFEFALRFGCFGGFRAIWRGFVCWMGSLSFGAEILDFRGIFAIIYPKIRKSEIFLFLYIFLFLLFFPSSWLLLLPFACPLLAICLPYFIFASL